MKKTIEVNDDDLVLVLGGGTYRSRLLVGDKQIGAVNELQIVVGGDRLFPEVSVEFPPREIAMSGSLRASVDEYVERLGQVGFVKVTHGK